MLSMIRSGPKMLLIGTPEPEVLSRYLSDLYPGIRGTFTEVFDGAREEHSIVILTQGNLGEAVPMSTVQEAFSLAVDMESLLCAILSDGMNVHIRQIRMATRMILLRSMGDLEKSLNSLETDFSGERGSVLDLMNRHSNEGAVVAFTQKPLHRVCGLEDIFPNALYVQGSFGTLFKELRSHGLKYLNAGIDNKDWVELEIRIYDRLSAYELHYKRLLQMIEALELGMILGEGWGKDHPRFMMTVDVYRVRLMTFLDPEEIKRYLVGLEYLEDGMRMADQDVYLDRKKLYWNVVAKGHAASREALGKLYRSKILTKLTPEEATEFLAVEAEIRRLQHE